MVGTRKGQPHEAPRGGGPPLRVLHYFPGLLSDLPPLLTAALSTAQSGLATTVLGLGASSRALDVLHRFGVRVHLLGDSAYPASVLGKGLLRVRFWIHLRRLAESRSVDVLWAHGAHAMGYRAAAGPGPDVRRADCSRALPLRVAHAHELYPEGSRLHRAQARFIRDSDVVLVPEETRGWILRPDAGYGTRFFVVPNQPADALFEDDPGACDGLRAYREAGGPPECDSLVLYQGLIDSGRCTLQLVEAAAGLEGRVGLLLVGPVPDRSYARALKQRLGTSPRVVKLDRIPYPQHVGLARRCRVGAVLYAPTDVNNIFCAPNKVYEYARAGVAMLLADHPPLRRLNELHRLGCCVDPMDPGSIRHGIAALLAVEEGTWRERDRAFLRAAGPAESKYAPVLSALRELVGRGVPAGA